MRFIRELNPETRKLLERISRASKFPQVRDRAKCIILSYSGFSIKELMEIFGVGRKTIYNWLTRWEDRNILGIYNEKGRGRKSKLNSEQKAQVKEWVKREPELLKEVVARVQKEWKIEISKDTIKRIIKKVEHEMEKNEKR